MKIKSSLFFIVLLIGTGFSQESLFTNNSLTLGFMSMFSTPQNQEILFNEPYHFIFIPNIKYNRFINSTSAFRLSIHRPFRRSNEKPPSNWNDTSEYEEFEIKAGYEYNFSHNRIIPYTAIDIVVIKSNSSRVAGGGVSGFYYKSELNKLGLGFAPLIGIKYILFNNIFVSFESSIYLLYQIEESIESQTYPITTDSTVKDIDKYFEKIINHFTFSFGFNF